MLKTSVKKILVQNLEGNEVELYLVFNMSSLTYLQEKYNIKIFKELQKIGDENSIDELFFARLFESCVKEDLKEDILGENVWNKYDINPLAIATELVEPLLEVVVGSLPQQKGKGKKK